MNIISFGFGALCVLVLFFVVLIIWGAVKLRSVVSDVKNLFDNISNVDANLSNCISDVDKKIDEVEGSIYREIDSRVDKLENKFKKQ